MLCVGAVSRRVVEMAILEGVHQIVASRAQVEDDHGYTGLTRQQLVDMACPTKIVRDHGGPMQGQAPDDGVESLERDIDAGFSALHLDVSKLPRHSQPDELRKLLERFGHRIPVEVGGEHDAWSHTEVLEDIAHRTISRPFTLVIDSGGHIHADRQVGFIEKPPVIAARRRCTLGKWRTTKAHNADWILPSIRKQFADFYNIAPEIALVETDALLMCLSRSDAYMLLEAAYTSGKWRRWFNKDEGTVYERARCAIRYIVSTYPLNLTSADEDLIRERIRDAIRLG